METSLNVIGMNFAEILQKGGAMFESKPKTVEAVELMLPAVGQHIRLNGPRDGWTLWHQNDKQKAKENTGKGTDKDWKVSCGPNHAEQVQKNLELVPEAIRKELGFRNGNVSKGGIRRVFGSADEALDWIQKITPTRTKAKTLWDEIPIDVSIQINRVLGLLMNPPDDVKIDLLEAVNNYLILVKSRNLKVRDLAEAYGKATIDESFQVDHPRRHKQYPVGGKGDRIKARVLIEFAEKFGDRWANEITEAEARDFIPYMNKCRNDETGKLPRQFLPTTVLSNVQYLSAMYKYANNLGQQHYPNPFFHICAKLRKVVKKKHELDQEREPNSIEELRRLLRVAWHTDKEICLAILLSTFAGFRRCEILRATGEVILIERNKINLKKKHVKNNTPARHFQMLPVLLEWLKLFPVFDKNEHLVSIPVERYGSRIDQVRRLAKVRAPMKDEQRKNFSIYTLVVGYTDSERRFLLGHHEKSDVLHKHYDGEASEDWAEKFPTFLMPKEVLGENPPPCTKAELRKIIRVFGRSLDTRYAAKARLGAKRAAAEAAKGAVVFVSPQAIADDTKQLAA